MKLYNELADWWSLMQPPSVFAKQAGWIAKMLQPEGSKGTARMLQLGSGGGHLASHLKQWFEMTLVDLSPQMLELSRSLNPDCRHLEGDMRFLRLEEEFDALLIYDAIAHLLTLEDLRTTMQTARAHLKRGGRALFCPDWTVEDFTPQTRTGGSDGPERGMRFIEWNQPEISGTVCRSDMVYILRHPNGKITIEHDPMQLGVFSESSWRDALDTAGFRVLSFRRRHQLIMVTAVAE